MRGLVLTISTSKPIWKKGIQKSTIDFIFMQELLVGQLVFYGPENTWAITADHIPIWIVLDTVALIQQTC